MTADLSKQFQQFVKTISMGEPQLTRMGRAADALRDFLVKSYGVPAGDVFLQGSYPNRTVIEPVEGGEYDIDMAAVCIGGGVSSDAALDDLERRLAADGNYKDRIERKSPCVRLRYSEDDVGKFHVDVVPLRRLTGAEQLEAPRRGSPWKQTAPLEYTQWCRDQGEQFARTVKILKRWRDEQQAVHHAIKSVVLQVLVAGVMPDEDDDATRIVSTLRSLHEQLRPLSAPPEVRNPVLSFEDLALSWSIQQFNDFVSELALAVELMDTIEATEDVAEAAVMWSDLLGPDFPIPSADELGLKLRDASHAKQPASKGWTVAPDRRCAVTISAQRSKHNRGGAMTPLRSGCPSPNDLYLRFRAEVVRPSSLNAKVYWQVVNTGEEAAALGSVGLRGEIFEGHDKNNVPLGDGTENWEYTKYKGCHEIRALLVSNNQVVATSDYFKVPIFKGRQR